MTFLGGNGAAKTDDGKPDPTPTTPAPTDTGKPTPTDTPSTPEPDPTTLGAGDTRKPTQPPAKDPDGDLADTGSDIPVGLIGAIAAAAVAAGGALTWWMRRRRECGCDSTGCRERSACGSARVSGGQPAEVGDQVTSEFG